jgi:hypothetical protein
MIIIQNIDSIYTGCHEYVPFAIFSKKGQCDVYQSGISINMTTAIWIRFANSFF